MKNKSLQILPILTALAMAGNSFAATINIGAVASSASTGYYVKEDGSFNLTGKIRVGTFSKTQAELQAIIDGWSDKGPSFSNWSALNGFFTEVGTGGLTGSTVAGWAFNSSTGAVAGTSSSVDTTVVPANAQLYVWASTISTFTAADFKVDGSTQWALVTDSVDWLAPASGTKSLNLQLIDASGVLIGTDLSTSLSSNNVKMVAAIPEPSTGLLAILGLVTLAMNNRKRRI